MPINYICPYCNSITESKHIEFDCTLKKENDILLECVKFYAGMRDEHYETPQEIEIAIQLSKKACDTLFDIRKGN